MNNPQLPVTKLSAFGTAIVFACA